MAALKDLRRIVTRRHSLRISLMVRVFGAFLLLFLPGSAPGVFAQSGPSLFPDLRSIVLGAADMPGYALDAARTALQDLPDGTVSYDAVFVRRTGSGPTEVRLAAARTASGRASAQALASTRDTLSAGGWIARDVPLLGDEAIGFEASADAAGGAGQAGHAYMFRYGRHLIGAVLVGPASSTTLDQALGYAVQMSSRLDAMLALAPVPDPDPAPAGVVAASTSPNMTVTSTSTGAGEGNQNRPAEPSNVVANAARPPVRVTTVSSDVRLENAPDLGNGFKLGGFSGLAAIDATGVNFFTTTDRGPNGSRSTARRRSPSRCPTTRRAS